MVARTELLDMAERCEMATGPDRELDCAIGVAIGRFTAEPPRYEGGDIQYREGNTWPGNGGDMMVPDYTRSIDAALTLLLPGYRWACGFSRFVPHQATVSSTQHAHGGWGGYSDHSRSLAICAAALRARADQFPAGES